MTGLREQLLDQLRSLTGHLDHIHQLAASAPGLLTPPATESHRPVTDDFPADPAERPTAVDEPMPEWGEGRAGAANDRVDAQPEGAPQRAADAADDPQSTRTAAQDAAGGESAGAPTLASAPQPAATPQPAMASNHRFRNRGGRLR